MIEFTSIVVCFFLRKGQEPTANLYFNIFKTHSNMKPSQAFKLFANKELLSLPIPNQ